MHTTATFAVAIVAGFIIAVVFGLAWFIAVPIAIFLLLGVVAYMLAFANERKGRMPDESRHVPSTSEASYDPVRDPSQHGTTQR